MLKLRDLLMLLSMLLLLVLPRPVGSQGTLTGLEPISSRNVHKLELLHLWSFKSGLQDLSWSWDGQSLVVGTSSGVWVYTLSDLDAPQRVFNATGECVVFSPTRDVLAICDVTTNNYLIQIIDFDAGTQKALPHHLPLSAAFSPDGRLLATAGDGGFIQIWDAQTLELLNAIRCGNDENNAVFGVAFSPDGSLLASRALHTGVQLWPLARFRPSSTPLSDSDGVQIEPQITLAFAFNPAGSRFLAAVTPPMEDASTLISVDFAASQTALADQAAAARAETWLPPSEDKPGAVLDLSYSPDGSLLAISHSRGTVELWAGDGSAPLLTLSAHEGRVEKALFNPAQTLLATLGFDDTVRLWGVAS